MQFCVYAVWEAVSSEISEKITLWSSVMPTFDHEDFYRKLPTRVSQPLAYKIFEIIPIYYSINNIFVYV